jgi:hypothetical protein
MVPVGRVTTRALPCTPGGADGLDEAGTEAEAGRLLAAVGGGPPVLLRGEGASCWPDGAPASDDAALVRAAVLAAVRAADGTDG